MEQTHSFGYWLRRRRKALDLTQEELAQRAGCVVTTIKKIEADARRPSKQLAERLAEVLAIPREERAAFLQTARAERAVDALDLAAQPLDAPQLHHETTVPLPTGTLTFLFTDIVGSTQLWEQHPEAMHQALARHDAILRSAIEAHGGVAVKNTGDGVLAAFPTATEALAMALETQRALQNEPWGVLGSLMVHMALHTGAAEVRESDYFGPALNRVARLLASGHGGQIVLSLAAAELVRDHLSPDVALRDLGVHQLKDLARPEQIFQVVVPDLPTDFPPLRTLDASRHNLPAQPTALIGRERELQQVGVLLQQADVRLVTLTGPGGTGKTRLGLQAAAELIDTFPDGVWFVALAAISDPALVATTIAQVLGIREGGNQAIVDQLKLFLREKQLLLVLDNFEQLLPAAPLAAELLAAAPKLKVLVTSRAVLSLSGEHEYAVPPLALPIRHDRAALEQLTQYAAVQLFIERTKAVKSDFVITNDNAPAVAEICYQLDGLPLAIELAAVRIKLFSPEGLLVRLGNRLKFLTGGARDLPARQQTIRNTIDWSYNLLDDGEKMLFARLSVFVGGFTLDAVEAVCNANIDLPTDALDGVAALIDKSLLRQEEGKGEPRFTMLETIREYALEQLECSGQAQTIAQLVWLDRLEIEHDNMRAALTWSLSAQDNLATGVQLAATLWPFWHLRGYLSEGRDWLARLLARVQASGISTFVKAKALHGAGALANAQGDYAQALILFRESVALFREVGDKHGTALALDELGFIAQQQGDYERARRMHEEGLALFRELGEKHGIANALHSLGRVARGLGDYRQATTLYQESLILFRERGDSWGTAMALSSLGILAWRNGNYTEARALFEQGLILWQELAHTSGIADTLHGLGLVAREQGDNAAARALFQQSLALQREQGRDDRLALSLHDLGIVARREGDYKRAGALLEKSLALIRQREEKASLPLVLSNLGELARTEGNFGRAAVYYEESLREYTELGDKAGIAWCLVELAGLSQVQGQLERAVLLLAAADTLLAAINLRPEQSYPAGYNTALIAAHNQFDAASFATAWAAGKAMSLDQAITEVLRRSS